ncbi:helix-turn-helix domain-containing protein [Spirillospora sp. NPDC127200]
MLDFPFLATECGQASTVVTVTRAIDTFFDQGEFGIMVRPQKDPASSLYALLSYYLRTLRLHHNMTQEAVAELLGCTKAQISRYESGERLLDSRECRILDDQWRTGGMLGYILGFCEMGADPTWLSRFFQYQKRAVQHRMYQNNLIPPPFQTEAYARGLLEVGYEARLVEDVEASVQRRMAHQSAMLEGEPQYWVVLDETALRPMGPVEVMRGQLDHLLEQQLAPNISIRVVPLSEAPHLGVDGSFYWFELPGRRQAAFAGTTLEIGRVIDDQEAAANVARRFDRIAVKAWNERQTREHLTRMRDDCD